MDLGFALTRHCNLRCAHCIRDDVTDVRSLSPRLFASVLDQAEELYEEVTVAFTGGEPLIHPRFPRMVDALARREVPWCMVTNGWHLRRAVPVLDRWKPRKVHLSLSGASREVHDDERGRGSWDRVLQSLAILTSRRIPTCFSLIVDQRTRGQLRQAADLAERLGANSLQFILPQPVPASAARGSDLPPEEWLQVRREVEALDREAGRQSAISLAYGAPFEGPESPCRTFRMERMYVDAEGRVAACCQLSEYGANDAEIVADLNEVSLADASRRYASRLEKQWEATRPDPTSDDPFLRFPCLRCAGACGKLEWLREFPDSPWHDAASMDGLQGAPPTESSSPTIVASGTSRELPVMVGGSGSLP